MRLRQEHPVYMLVAADLTWVMTKPARDYVVDDDDDDKQRPGRQPLDLEFPRNSDTDNDGNTVMS